MSDHFGKASALGHVLNLLVPVGEDGPLLWLLIVVVVAVLSDLVVAHRYSIQIVVLVVVRRVGRSRVQWTSEPNGGPTIASRKTERARGVGQRGVAVRGKVVRVAGA